MQKNNLHRVCLKYWAIKNSIIVDVAYIPFLIFLFGCALLTLLGMFMVSSMQTPVGPTRLVLLELATVSVLPLNSSLIP